MRKMSDMSKVTEAITKISEFEKTACEPVYTIDSEGCVLDYEKLYQNEVRINHHLTVEKNMLQQENKNMREQIEGLKAALKALL